ncbi:MAG: ATP-binding cassette domain-containing protein [Pirellulaceae bacterium]|nr:ATP-binding cassette domain-containing protein [Pirellulaceae bacterium]
MTDVDELANDVAMARPTPQPLIELRAMTLQFAKQTILNNINLTIPRGQTVAVIGESGCGKTMLLKSVTGLLTPTSGSMLYDGVDIHSLGDVEMTKLRCKFGFVFQNAALFDSMTIGQNVAFPVIQHNLANGKNIDRMVIEGLAEVGLPEIVLHKRPSQLSGGMRKRVGIARALILQPDLMLYDEPTTGLDPIMSDVINELMLRTRLKGKVTSLIVTHDMRTARKVADRVVMLYPYSRLARGENQVIYDGPPEGLDTTKDKRVRQFVEGEAGERLMELQRSSLSGFEETPRLSDTYRA